MMKLILDYSNGDIGFDYSNGDIDIGLFEIGYVHNKQTLNAVTFI